MNKKLLLSALAICAMVSATTAQKNIFDEVADLKGVEYVKYGYVESIEGKKGHYKPVNLQDDTVTFKVRRLKSGTPIEYYALNQNGKEELMVNVLTHHNVDHFSQTAITFKKVGSTMQSYLVIDGMLIGLKYPREDGTYKSIGGVYLPVVKETATAETPKKKLTMKEKLKAAKSAVGSAYGGGSGPIKGNSAHMKYVNMNIDSLVASYVKKMQALQASADPKKEAAVEAEIAEGRKSWDKEVADSWDTEEGRRVMANMTGHSDKNSYVLRNDTGREIDVMIGGKVVHLSANRGHTSNIDCTTNSYYAVNKNGTMIQGNLITKGHVSCGNTFSVK